MENRYEYNIFIYICKHNEGIGASLAKENYNKKSGNRFSSIFYAGAQGVEIWQRIFLWQQGRLKGKAL